MSTSYLLHFKTAEAFKTAIEVIEKSAHFDYEAYSSHDVADDEDPKPEFRVIKFAALMGAMGGLSLSTFFQWFANVRATPLDIGGRPLNSWPAFIPICFVFTVLCTGLSVVVAFLYLTQLPMPHHPVFEAKTYNLSSRPYSIWIQPRSRWFSLPPSIEEFAPQTGAIDWEVIP